MSAATDTLESRSSTHGSWRSDTETPARFRHEHLADRIQEAVRSAPPLTDEQRSRIADILVGGR